MSNDIIAAGPKTLHLNGYLPLRVVLRDLSVPGHAKFVVHYQVFPEDRESFFEQGDYIENPYGGPFSTKAELLEDAWAAFTERCARAMRIYPVSETALRSEDNGECMPTV